MGSDKNGRPFSAGRSSSGLRNPGVACHERRRVGEIDWRVFLSSTPSCAESDRGRPQDSGRIAGRVRPHLWHTSRLTSALRAPAGQGLRAGRGAGVALSDAIEPGSRVAPNQTIDLPKRLVEVTGRQLQCTLERKIEHANRLECQGRAPSCRKGCGQSAGFQ